MRDRPARQVPDRGAKVQHWHAAATAAGKSDILAQYARDYPKGPHDQPQSMCPAFGSLGKLFEDIRDAVYTLADPALYDTVVVTCRWSG